MSFSLTEFVQSARSAAAETRPVAAVKTLMSQTFADPQGIAKAVGSLIQEDEILYEDDQVSDLGGIGGLLGSFGNPLSL